MRCPGLHEPCQGAVERGDRDKHRRGLAASQFPKQIAVTCYQMMLGYDEHGIAERRRDFEAAEGELQAAFEGLIRIGDTAHSDDL